MRSIRQRCFAVAVIWLLATSAFASDILVLGPETPQVEDVRNVLARRLTPLSISFEADKNLANARESSLVLLIGHSALETYCLSELSTPALALFVYSARFEAVRPSCRGPISAVFSDAPIELQLALADALFQSERKAVITASAEEANHLSLSHSDLVASPDVSSNVNQTIGFILNAEDWSALMLTMDEAVYSGANYRTSLETLYRNRKAAIAPVRGLVNAGATGAVYFDKAAIIDSVVASVSDFFQATLPPPSYPQTARVALNLRLLRSVFGMQLTEADANRIEGLLNE